MSDTPTETTAAPDDDDTIVEPDDARDAIVADLAVDIGDGLIDSHVVPGIDVWVRVATDAWPSAMAALKNRGFDFFCFLSAIDWMPSPYGNSETDPFADEADEIDTTLRSGYTGSNGRFQLLARLTNLSTHLGVTIKSDVPDSMTMPTIVPVFAGANWHEREAREMFGIFFEGHPDMRNLYLPTEFEGHPLRKDFPLLARQIKPWPGIADVEPMAGGDDE